jgi:hypothetical protein
MENVTTWIEVPGFDLSQWLHCKREPVTRRYSAAREIFIERIQMVYKVVSHFPHEMMES